MGEMRLKLIILLFLTSTFGVALAQNSVVVVPLGSDETTRVFAQGDADFSGQNETNAGQIEVNSITFDAPRNGFVVIAGQVFINNNNAGSKTYSIRPKLDGVLFLASAFATDIELAGTGTQNTDLGTLSYTVTTAISAGQHTVSQTAGPNSGTASFFHNAESLSVIFISTGSTSITSVAASRLTPLTNSESLDSEGNQISQ